MQKNLRYASLMCTQDAPLKFLPLSSLAGLLLRFAR